MQMKKTQIKQQIKDDQINYLLGDPEKNLEEYKFALEAKENSCQMLEKYYFLLNKVMIL